MKPFIILFEDHTAEDFRPLSWSLPVYELRCGILNLRERIAHHAFVFSPEDQGKGQEVTISVTVSIGIAELTGKPDNLETLLGRADSALYAAKHAGRDCVRLFVASGSGVPPS